MTTKLNNNNNTTTTTTVVNSGQQQTFKYNTKNNDTHQISKYYDLEETIGQGHFAVVKLGKHIFTGEKVAIKVIDKTKLDQISREHLFQEVRCMKLVQHPNVVRLYEVIDTTTKLYLILELGDGGDMYDYIMRHTNGLSEIKARNYFKQILRAIKYCHDLHVVHRDLKPENVVFFERTGEVKLTDFGFSNIFIPGKKLNTSCGSLAYSAPEILLGDSYDAPAVDVWSLGVILYMLVTGRAPFQEANDSETLTMILDCKYYLPSELSVECKNLISRMLVREPEKRIELNDIAKHDWLICDNNGKNDNYDVPLIKRKELSENIKNDVINSMIKGNIATIDEIKKALKDDNYSYITATYYLLAERILRRNSSLTNNDENYVNYKNRNQPSKGSLNKNQQSQQQQVINNNSSNNNNNNLQQQQQQQHLQKQNSVKNTNKRKFNKNLVISEVEANEENEEEESEEKKEIKNNICEKSPIKVKINDFGSEEKLRNSESNFEYIEEIMDCEEYDFTNNNNNISSSNRRAVRETSRELLSFAIPEEAEETNLIEINKENDSNNIKQSTKHNHVHNTSHLLKEIHEEESEKDCSKEENVIDTTNDLTLKSTTNQNDNNSNKTKLQKIRMKYPSISASSTDDDTENENLVLNNDEAKKIHKSLKQHKKSNNNKQTTHQSRVRPVSISDITGNEEITHKVTIRAKSVESSSEITLSKHHHHHPNQQLSLLTTATTTTTTTGNDLAPPSNYNLKSLSIEHRLANISQMSISSQLSKTNSIRHNSRSGACDTPIQHVHSSTPTPRESIVFNRGDEKPIAKILLQQQQQHQLQKLQQQQQQSQHKLSNGSITLMNQNSEQQQQQPIESQIQDQLNEIKSSSLRKIPTTNTSNNNNNNNNVNQRTVSINSLESNDSNLSEYENTTLKSNRTLIKNPKTRNLNDSYNNAITSTQETTLKTTSTSNIQNDNIKNNTHSIKNNDNNIITKKNSKLFKSNKTRNMHDNNSNSNNNNNNNKCCCIL